MLFDFCRQIYVAAVLLKHGRMRIAKGSLISSCRYMKQIDIGFNLLCNRNSTLKIVALLNKLGAAHTKFNREEWANCLTNGLQYLNCKTTAILNRAAVVIGSMIKHWGQKLIDQPAMTAVNHDHLKTGTLCHRRCFSIRRHNVVNHFLRQLTYLHTVRSGTGGWSPLAHFLLLCLVGHVGSRIHTRMGQLNRRNASVAADRICCVGCRCKRI